MQWIAPPGKDSASDTLEKRLWDTADQFRANSGLSAAQYSQPILGWIFRGGDSGGVTMAKGKWKPRRLDELGFVGRGKSRHRPRNEARLYGGPRGGGSAHDGSDRDIDSMFRTLGS
jgi:hypothetical protein